MGGSETPVQDQRCQSGPSAITFTNSPTPATFACWKIRFDKIEVCTCSQFRTKAMLSIKEVETDDSVDDLQSSCSVRGIRMPNFEVLDTKIASVLNRIIHNTQSKRKVSLEEQETQKEDRFLRGRQIAYLIYESFRVTGANDPADNHADLFTNCFSKRKHPRIWPEMWLNFLINDENPIWWHFGRIVQI